MSLAEGSNLTPIPFGEEVSSLSAILLQEEYYAFLKAAFGSLRESPWSGRST
jgi:hypothetical protein